MIESSLTNVEKSEETQILGDLFRLCRQINNIDLIDVVNLLTSQSQ